MTTERFLVFLASFSAIILAVFKWVVPIVQRYYEIHFYNNSVGHRIVKDIERQLGKEASDVIVSFMKDSCNDRANHGQRLNLLENSLGLGIYVCNPDGLCVYANDTLASMFGLSRHEMIGSGWLAPVQDKQKVYHEWMFAVKNRVPYRNEYTLLVGGKEVQCMAEAEETKTDDGIVLGYVGTVTYAIKKAIN